MNIKMIIGTFLISSLMGCLISNVTHALIFCRKTATEKEKQRAYWSLCVLVALFASAAIVALTKTPTVIINYL